MGRESRRATFAVTMPLRGDARTERKLAHVCRVTGLISGPRAAGGGVLTFCPSASPGRYGDLERISDAELQDAWRAGHGRDAAERGRSEVHCGQAPLERVEQI